MKIGHRNPLALDFELHLVRVKILCSQTWCHVNSNSNKKTMEMRHLFPWLCDRGYCRKHWFLDCFVWNDSFPGFLSTFTLWQLRNENANVAKNAKGQSGDMWANPIVRLQVVHCDPRGLQNQPFKSKNGCGYHGLMFPNGWVKSSVHCIFLCCSHASIFPLLDKNQILGLLWFL